MSYYDYRMGQRIELERYPFYALIQAAMRQADTPNLQMLKESWPEVWEELETRYNAPQGLLPYESLPEEEP